LKRIPPDEFTLSIKTEGQGSVTRSPDQDTYTDGDRVTLTAAPSSGWSFKQWKGDLSGSTNPVTITIDKNKSVTAVFEEDPPDEFTLSIKTEGQGSVTRSPDQDSYTDGELVTLTAAPSSGWSFKQWKGDLSGSTNPVTITVDKNKSVTAVFDEDATAVLTIDEVKLFIEEMELGGARRTDDFETSNFVLNLPLDGSRFRVTHVELPAGFYDELELEISKPESGVIVGDPDFRDGSRNYSLVVRGTYNGTNFIFRSDSDFEIDVDINPHLEIKRGENSVIAIAIDFERWFKDSDDSNLNPNDSKNSKQINENIKKSLSDFEDNF
jgi:ribosomal protein L11